jgi:hypothetical protein
MLTPGIKEPSAFLQLVVLIRSGVRVTPGIKEPRHPPLSFALTLLRHLKRKLTP